MKNTFFVPVVLIILMPFSSCQSVKNWLNPDYSVEITESTDAIKEKIAAYTKTSDFLRKFKSIDKAGKKHEFIIYDRQYMSIDGNLYAYRFHSIMYYGLALTMPGGTTKTVSGSEKMLGLQGYATLIDYPDTSISFIFARKLFAQKGYNSMHEAAQIPGVSFSGKIGDTGYIDDFGRWQKYTYFDFFDDVFKTSKKLVSQEMYSAMEIEQKF